MHLTPRYRVLETLGRGAGGAVHLVEDAFSPGRPIALKLLPGNDQALVQALRREFEVLAALRHPRLAEVYDFGRIEATDPGGPATFLTREFLEGESLGEATVSRSPADSVRLAVGLCRALEALHQAGLVHGDLKPDNAILDRRGVVRLIDFGLVRAEGDTADWPAGTLPYLAPEVLRGEPADPRSDLYSLGILLYELLAGAPPFSGPSRQVVEAHLHAEVPALEPAAGLDAESLASFDRLAAVVGRLLAKDPAARYPGVRELQAALELAVPGARAAEPETEVAVSPARLGRDEPLAALEAAIDSRLYRAWPTADSIVAVRGGPGSGKTTLLREVRWIAQLRGAHVVEVTCDESPGETGPVAELVRRLELLAPRRAREQAGASLDERAATAALAVAAVRPTVLVFDDLHLAGPETGATLRYLAHGARPDDPLLVLVSYLDEGSEGAVSALGDHRAVDLAPLTADEVGRLVSSVLGRRDEQLSGAVLEWTGGNPLFCVEVLTAIRRAGGVAAGGFEAIGVPSRLEEFWASRATNLEADGRALLEASAALGRPASLAFLAGVGGLDQSRSELAADSLLSRGLLRRTPAGELLAAHAGLAAAVRAGLDEAGASALHARAAHALAAARAPASETAHHLLRAGPERRAAGRALALEAARGLLERGRARPAARLLENAAEGWGRAMPESAVLLLAEAHCSAGEYRRAAEVLEPDLPRLEGEQRASALALLGRLHSARGEYEAAARAWSEALELLGEASARSRVRRDLGRMLLKRGDHRGAEEVSLAALSELGPEDPLRADLLCTLGMASDYGGDAASALGRYGEALGIARSTGARREEAAALTSIAITHQRRSDLAMAREAYREALSIARELGDVGSMSMLHGNLGGLAHLSGEPVTALEHYEAAGRLARRVGRETTAVSARANLGLLHLYLGEYERARVELDAALCGAERLGLSTLAAQATAQLGELALRQGRLDEAVELYLEARGRYEELGRSREGAEVAIDLAGALVERAGPSDLRQAAERLDQARRAEAMAGDGALEARAALVEARLLAARGEEDRALAQLGRSATRAREEGSVEVEWEAEAVAADLLLRRGAPLAARGKLQRTVELLEQLAAALPAELRKSFWQDRRRAAARAALERAEAGRSSGEGGAPQAGSDAEMLYRLLEINKRINSDADLPRLLERIMDSAVELTGAERGFILLSKDGGQLEIQTARDFDQGTPDDAHLQFSRSIAETVLIDGEPVITINAMDDNRFSEYLSVHKLRLQSVLGIPIRSRGRAIGVLYMENRLRRGGFGEPDQRLLLAFADQVAIALENARLLGELTRRQGELERAKEEIERLCEERGRMLNRRTAQLEEARRDLRQAMDQLRGRGGFHGIVGQSEPMLRVFAVLERVTQTDVPVVITGESGTGKEMVARAIHAGGQRAKKPFVAINCGAIPETLLESELFGHVRGSFTGADRDKRGLILSAHGGTVFLDEIGDMPVKMQLDLLRVLQERKVRPVGSEKDLSIDVRILAASNRPLRELIQQGSFREDLYYRLSVVEVGLPPLRERADDVPLLVDHFLSQLAARFGAAKKGVSGEAVRALMGYPWPGNVRQLEHALMNAWVMCDGEAIGADDLTLEPVSRLSRAEAAPLGLVPASAHDRQRVEKNRILEALERSGWNRSKAAKLLDMPRRTLYRRLKSYGIQ